MINELKQVGISRRDEITSWAEDNPYMGYNPTEKEIQTFYRSKPWLAVRQQVLNRDNYIDQFELVENDRIIPGNTVHHIIPLRERWDLRADIRNLEVISRSNHNREHPERNGGSVVRTEYETRRRNARLVHAVKIKTNDELI
ncbi:HNH endonuclease [Leuconostoc falkenbergense]|uniref:HNH endonuclease n=1 Tax=Leuconostoc falkenbergense TaxID=2766470 RepID=UPI0009B693CF|nr:HNH endonuclease [Leuconostoc falkenbergense]MDG9745644.1 HNH endonuclease [Leuconostoc falkenbergense]